MRLSRIQEESRRVGYSRLSVEQQNVIARHVKGGHVWDLGFGSSEAEPRMLQAMGAAHITAVDKDQRSQRPRPYVENRGWGLVVHAYFHELVSIPAVSTPGGIAYLSWPVTWHNEEVPLLRGCEKVIYVGLNRNATACGGPSLWGHFLFRELIEEVQGEQNDLLVYGKMLSRSRSPAVREEIAAVTSWSDCIDFP